MGKTRDLFKKIGGIKKTFPAKIRDNKRQNQKGPNRSRRYEEKVARIHRTVQEKALNDPDNHDVITYLQPDILECEVNWALGSIL